MDSGMKILYASAEVVPFAKTGGLADVAGALPKVLAKMGHDARIVMPLYSCIDREKFGLRPVTKPFSIPHGHEKIKISIEESDAIDGVKTYFIRNDYLFDRPGLYGQADDDHRFVAYARGIVEMLSHLDWKPDIINCNDWHTGLVPVYLKTLYANKKDCKGIGTLYTIHNLAYQGVFPAHVMDLAGLPWDLFTWDKLEYWGKFNFMKAGLVFADMLSTVSPTYAKETQSEEYGEGLQGVLSYRKDDYYGILNGIDYEIWNPRRDTFTPAHFSRDALAGKRQCKQALQQELGLPSWDDAPLFGLISRLSSQKGLDLLDAVLPDLLQEHRMQVAVLGTGDNYYEDMLAGLANKFPEKLSVSLRFDNALAHRIYAGSDGFLMPSRYEPCGLGQIISLAYGTVPVVRETGGLADTVKEFDRETGEGNGFIFAGYTPRALRQAILRALECYDPQSSCWQRVMTNAMACDFSWEASARKYLEVYKKASERAQATNHRKRKVA